MSISTNAMSTLLPSKNEIRCASSVGDVFIFYEKCLGEMCQKCFQNIATAWVHLDHVNAFPLLVPIELFSAFESLRVIFFCLFHCNSKRLLHLRDTYWIHLLVRCKQLSGEPLSCWLLSELLPCRSVILKPLLAAWAIYADSTTCPFHPVSAVISLFFRPSFAAATDCVVNKPSLL